MTVTDQLYTARGVQGVAMQQKWIDYLSLELDNLKSLLYLDNFTYQDFGIVEYVKRVLFTIDNYPEFMSESEAFAVTYIPWTTFT